MTAKKNISIEKVVKTAEESLLKKLSDRMEVVEVITETGVGGNGPYSKEIKKEKLIKADLNAIIFALKAHSGEKWNLDEKEMNKAKLEKLRAEAGSLTDSAAFTLSEKLSNYTGIDSEQIKFS